MQNVEGVGNIVDRLDSAAQQALPHIVNAYWWGIIGYIVAIVFSWIVVAFLGLTASKALKSDPYHDKGFTMAIIAVAMGLIAMLATVACMGDIFAGLADPLGAFIINVVSRHK